MKNNNISTSPVSDQDRLPASPSPTPNDFLSRLKPLSFMHTPSPLLKESDKEIFFLLDFDEKGAKLNVVDKKRQNIHADYRRCNGDTAQVLRSLDRIRAEQQYKISWSGEDTGIYLDEYPHLVYQVARCSNLIDAEGKPIHISNLPATLQLLLESDDDKKEIHPYLQLQSAARSSKDIRFLSDSFVLSEGTVYQTEPTGDNFRQIPLFLTPFSEKLLEDYLSIFFSYIENITPVYEDYEVIFSPEEISAIPTLLFEKVDADKALYLRLIQSFPGISPQLQSQFELSRIASVGMNRKILVRRARPTSMYEASELLRKQILQYAPDRQAQKEIFQEGNFFIIPAETAEPFLLQGLQTLLKNFQLAGAEKLREYQVRPIKPQLKLTIGSGIDFLEGEASLQIDEEQFSLQQILTQYRQQRYIQLSDGNRAIVDEGYIRRLERIFRQHRKGKGNEVKISFFDLPEVEDLLEERQEGAIFEHHRKLYEGFNQLARQKFKSPATLQGHLRPYQQEGVKWMKYLYDNRMGGCLADDMGLGKTIQAIALLTSIYPKTKRPSLIIMPRSLLFNWQGELIRFAPSLSVYTYYGNTRLLDEAMKHQLILTTYAIVRNDIDDFRKKKFHLIILDESQNIKNLTAQSTQAVLLLQTEHRLALSGTPVENNLTELYSLFRFLNPAMFGSADDFNQRYALPIQRENDKEALLSLRKKIFPFMLRRLKKDVLPELPDRIEQTLYVEMEKEQADFYEQRRLYYYRQVKQSIADEGLQKSQFVMFQALNELRRIASVPESLSGGNITSPKLDLLIDHVCEAVENRHKTVVFFNFIAGIELAGERLEALGIDYTCMTGSTHDRRSVVERFQNNPHCMVLLMTLKTGGVGLNLTAADTVFIFEPWWNKAAEEQAINRLHRIGQTAKVLSYSLITRNTIEEKIRLLQQQKAELFEGLIGNDTTSSKQLTEEDINYILG